MTSFTIDELSIPETVDAPGAVDFAETVLVHNESEAAAIGLDLGYTLAESLPSWHDPYVSQRLLAARVDGKIVGRATLNVAQDAEDAEAWFEIDVLPQYRERGIGTALYTRITEFALADGRTVLEADVLHSNSPGARLTAATGHGSVPRESPETRFLLERGFTLEQVERMGKLPLPVDQGALDSHFTTANRAAGSEYRIHEWSGSTPENWLTDLAMLHARMSTDARPRT